MQLDILIVEDDTLQRRALFDRLTAWGHVPKGCETLAECRTLLHAKWDLILLDRRLPDGDGVEFLLQGVPDDLKNRVVIMTAFADVQTAVKAIKAGAYDYLPKPFEDEHLQKVVRNISERTERDQRIQVLGQTALSGHDGTVWQLDEMIGSEALGVVFERAQTIAQVPDTTVLILGETGTGKGMLAKAIHRLSRRRDQPFIEVNCSAIPAQLIESEIFGHEKGAFTDAKTRKPGLLEVADKGSLFLDEIGDMEISLQSKLLKVIEDKEFRPLGSARTLQVDVRILAATSRDLPALVRQGRFREDLYYRLAVAPITLPPLREQKSAILPLATFFLNRYACEWGRTVTGFTPEAKQALLEYAWPGNIRELRNVIERSLIFTKGKSIDRADLGLSARPESQSQPSDTVIPPMSLQECEKRLIESVLRSVSGNRNKAAEILRIHRTTLYKKIEEYEIGF